MYNQMRNEMLTAINEFLSPELSQEIITVMDKIAKHYTIQKAETLPAIASGIPAEVGIYLGSKKIEGLSEKTLQRYAYCLKGLFIRLNKALSEITTNDIRMYLYEYQQNSGIGSRSLDGIRQVINGFFEWCVTEDYLPKNPCKAIKQIKYEKKQRESLTRLELEYVRQECKDNVRLTAVIEFLYSTGCRVSELCEVRLNEINHLTSTVLLHGKGNKDRYAYINDKCSIALSNYLNSRKQDSEYLFCSTRAPYTKLSKEIIDREFKQTFSELSARIGKPISPHIIRHTTATLGLQGGMDITQVQKMLGHASVSTTMIYAQVSDNAVQEAHKKYVV